MAYLGTEKLKELINTEQVIGPNPDLSRVKSGAYELSLGNEVFRTDSKDKKKEILKLDKEQVTINSGQFALLLTQETVNIPQDKIAFISIKAGVKLRGLVNVSGFHVDPGFKGNLVFSVYNAGTSPISLEKGEPYFLIWFAELKLVDNEATTYNGEHKGQDSIPTKYIDALIAGELASPNVLLEKINDNYKSLDSKATTRDYFFKTGLGILIVIAIKFFVDWGMYSKGVNDGYYRKTEETQIDSTINQLLLEKKNLIIEINSLSKIKADTTKKK
jgi:dCTP deaminase